MKYLGGRGLADETVEEFRLGYASPGWDGLAGLLAGKKVNPADVPRRPDCLVKGERGFYDRFGTG